MVVHTFATIWFYPVFRFVIFLIFGIFCADVLFQGTLPEEGMLWIVAVLLPIMLVVSRKQQYAWRQLFGGLVFLFVFCVGALLVQHKRIQTMYVWPHERSVYHGVICDFPQEKSKTYLYKVNVLYRMSESQQIPVNRTLLIYVMKDSLSKELQCGDQLLFYTRVLPPLATIIPSGFDYTAYLFRQQISGTAMVFSDSWKKVGVHVPLSIRQRALVWRQQILDCYRNWGFSGDEFAVLSALTVGYKGELTHELKETYQMAGVSHILALSGMHVAILWGILSRLMRLLNRKQVLRWIKCIVIILLLIGFAFLTGLSASVVRAVVMCALMTVAQATGKPSFAINTLAVTAFFMLIYNPFYLFDVGFQLSFLAVFSILVIYPVVFHSWRVSHPVLRYVWGLIAVSLSAQIGTAPLVIYYFTHFPIYFLLANLIVSPLVLFIFYGALAIFLFSPASMIHECLVKGMDVLLRLLNETMQWIEQLPYARQGEVHVSVVEVCIYYIILMLGLGYYIYRSRRLFIAMCLGINILLGTRLYLKYFTTQESFLYLSRSQVKSYPDSEIWQQDSIYYYKGLTVCLLTDNRWQDKISKETLHVDYLYLCRGYKGKIASLQNLFHIRTVVLDPSLGEYRLQRIKEECNHLKLEYIDISDKGSFRIIP